MKLKSIFVLAFVVGLLNVLHGQTSGYWNDFSLLSTSSWVNASGVPSNAFTFSNTSQELNVVANSTGYNNFEHSFSPVNLSKNPVLKLKIKTTSAVTIRIDLTDAAGHSTNATSIQNNVTVSSNYVEYTFNYKGKFAQAYGGNFVVDSTKITKISIFTNPGSSFTGTLKLDDLIIGDKIKTIPLNIRLNQIGYEKTGSKKAIVETDYAFTDTMSFYIYNSSGQKVYTGQAGAYSQVTGWGNRYFRTLDFSGFATEGTGYTLKAGNNTSYSFDITAGLLFKKTADACVSYFTNMRSTDTRDNTLGFYGSTKTANVYGGWWDAAGDPGKHMSHLSYANYFNPQQIPLVVWSLLKSYDLSTSVLSSSQKIAFTAEAAWGADYLVRNTDAEGYLYLAVFDDWGGSSNRQVCEWGQLGDNAARTANYKAAMREGAGMAIAALARAYSQNLSSTNYTKTDYLNAAIKLYTHLKSTGTGYKTKNIEYCNNHTENLIDFYCGLMAATELYKATANAQYANDATYFATKLKNWQKTDGWFLADSSINRPFYHASDEGLPIVALEEFAQAVPAQSTLAKNIMQKWYKWYLKITNEIANPFGYVKEYNSSYNTTNNTYGTANKAFFVPRENETGYWWQGENARLASMASAALLASNRIQTNYTFGADSISNLAISQMDWIAGKNPFGVCMIYGFGSSTYPNYVPGGSNKKTNIAGGICNGITANATLTDLEWLPYDNTDGSINWQNWRWVEQWLPHTSWWLIGASSMYYKQNNLYTDCNNVVGGLAFVDSCGKCAGGTTNVSPVLRKSECSVTSVSDSQIEKMVLSISPNPSTGVLQFKSNNTFMYSCEVYNMYGTKYIQKNIMNEDTLNLTGLPSGTYLILLKNGEHIHTEKITLEK